MLEHELKFSPGPFFRVPDLAAPELGLRADAPDTLQLHAVYYDTDDYRLARAGASLRWRNVEGWTVKLPIAHDAGSLTRQELHIAGDPSDDPPEAAIDLVHALVRRAPLRIVARLDTVRKRIVLRDEQGAKVCEFVDDEVSLLDGSRLAARFRELEVEFEAAAAETLEPALIARLRAAGSGDPDPVPKIVRALGPRAADPPDVTPPPPLDFASTPQEVVQAAIATSTLRLLVNDPGVRIGIDPEGVHQARVATRRMRSDLRVFRRVLDETWSEPIRAELKWLGAILGAVRDAEVLQDRLDRRLAELPPSDVDDGKKLLHILADRREEARVVLLEGMRSERYLALLDRLVDASQAPKFADELPHELSYDELMHDDLPGDDLLGDDLLGDDLSDFARRPWRKLRRAVEALEENPTDHELHQVRISAKRSRYAAEAVAPALDKEVRTFAKAVTALQDVLGEHQDAVIAGVWLRENQAAAPFVAGELTAMERFAAEAARDRWSAVWKQAKRKDLRLWM